MSSLSLVTGHVEQESTLFILPPEIRNYILELSMTSNKPIMLRAEKDTKRKIIFFHTPLPAVTAVCKRLRAETPLRGYYTNNTFLFSDSMFQANVLPAFRAVRGPGVESMTQIKIFHTPRLGRSDFNFRITATFSPRAGIKLTHVEATANPSLRHLGYLDSGELCYCFVEALVESISNEDAEKRGKLFRLIVGYFEGISNKIVGWPDKHIRYCQKCARIRANEQQLA